MQTLRGLCVLILVLGTSACTTTRQVTDATYRPPQGNYKMIVVQPDISVGVLTAGGAFEFREDWTEQSRQNVLNALVAEQGKRGGETKITATREETGADPTLVADLVWLHKAVGQSIGVHKFSVQTLPTKKDKFDWTLGGRAVEFGNATQFDYALFLHAQDSFASEGRVALQLVGLLGCGLGVCVVPTGGAQFAFASLVDLKTGQIVWFNTLASGVGDIRTPQGAQAMVAKLLTSMQPTSNTKAKRRV